MDARGLNCPLPALRAQKALQALAPGQTLTVLATDPAARIDIAHLCNTDGHVLLSLAEEGSLLRFVIVRG